MAAEEYTLGTPVWFEATFTSEDTGAPADPTAVQVRVWESNDAADDVQTFVYDTDAAVERTSVGVYRVRAVPTRAGRIYTSWTGEGAVEVSATEYAIINDSLVPS
jgi:hypothetical protein